MPCEPGREDAREALVSLPRAGTVARDVAARPVDRGTGRLEAAARGVRRCVLVTARPVRGGHARSRGDRARARRPTALVAGAARPGARRALVAGRLSHRLPRGRRAAGRRGRRHRGSTRSRAGSPQRLRRGGRDRRTGSRTRTRGGRVSMIDADSGRLLWRSAPAGAVTELAWSSDGTPAARGGAARAAAVRCERPPRSTCLEMPAGTRAETAAFRPAAHEFALVSHVAAATAAASRSSR